MNHAMINFPHYNERKDKLNILNTFGSWKKCRIQTATFLTNITHFPLQNDSGHS